MIPFIQRHRKVLDMSDWNKEPMPQKKSKELIDAMLLITEAVTFQIIVWRKSSADTSSDFSDHIRKLEAAESLIEKYLGLDKS